MPFQIRENTRCKICTLSGAALMLLFLPLGQPISSRAEVFHQLGNDMIVPFSGVSADAPKASIADNPTIFAKKFSSTSFTAATNYQATTSVILDAPSILDRGSGPSKIADLKAGRLIEHRLRLPKPRKLSTKLSARQTRMRRLTLEVGRRYAGAAGVARSRLDRESFVLLFATMIQRESNFDPEAISAAGAKGLGQLMPDTARELGVCDVLSARDNLEGAARYLTAMLHQFGSPELALAAYNAGPDAVRKYGVIPPYRETQQYVSDILNNMNSAPGAIPHEPKPFSPAPQEASLNSSDTLDMARLPECDALRGRHRQDIGGTLFGSLNVAIQID
ncbi:lytic transglycosylase domain-containing protein [Rhizobium leguminosarum bv. viciae]|uniref:lytic transglycosylase domain-containing protein n=1 Tax=Rhizobium TaxID=379 RepID=UPI00103EFD0E|nr:MULTISPECIES: lytic transglycosylase domain-containing protein [Rhizobium]MBY5482690.1 lytic transglycosylase domain-containing protein [Rhizobium leguminosarum]MBY5856160.1 lytic transglycosylase domain-containing protein [Rhizobium leguminosarum]MBY5877489.1 lytic transglycosylase domain-containing protein [Rhizobium leguminosarum]NEI25099.1 transglycosylase SLT domain-containing protein [Rhizobium ruizarguesonis]NEI32257.1 transglycosylase SLT domain-containing protein [Rhizobium ruizarg